MIVIYVANNLVNDKLYVGQSKNFKKRYRNHIDAKTSMAFHNAIRKYGAKNFRFQIVEFHETREDANEAEQFFIEYLRSRTHQHGYNDASGGEVYEHSKEAKRKISEAKKRWNAQLTPEVRLARSRHANDGMTPEVRRANATKASLSILPEQRVINGRKGAASVSHERCVERGKKSWLKTSTNETTNRIACIEGCKAWWAQITPEEKQARSKKMHLAKAEKAAAKLLATNEPIQKYERRPPASD